MRRHKRPDLKWHLRWLVPLLVLDVILTIWWKAGCHRPAAPAVSTPAQEFAEVEVAPPPEPPPSPWKTLRLPTAQEKLLDGTPAEVFQATASGNPESGMFGTVRTANNGSGLLPHFHEGIDIAALKRGRGGRPEDEVHAVMDGTIGYINRIGGNSNYGIYVVLLHHDTVGEFYTLYAHLASVPRELRAGQPVKAGDLLGIIGNTSSSPIPMARAHLHFEVGLICNSNFAQWYRAQKLKPDHGNFHGRNFLGMNPIDVLSSARRDPDFNLVSYLHSRPPAFELEYATSHRPDFFRRYPSLWDGPAYDGGPVVLDCSDNGVLLRGRNASAEEQQAMAGAKTKVLSADETVLGRNGCRLVVRVNGSWKLGRNGDEWLDVLTY